MVELVDTWDLKSHDHCGRAGSTPAPGTKSDKNLLDSLSDFLFLTQPFDNNESTILDSVNHALDLTTSSYIILNLTIYLLYLPL